MFLSYLGILSVPISQASAASLSLSFPPSPSSQVLVQYTGCRDGWVGLDGRGGRKGVVHSPSTPSHCKRNAGKGLGRNTNLQARLRSLPPERATMHIHGWVPTVCISQLSSQGREVSQKTVKIRRFPSTYITCFCTRACYVGNGAGQTPKCQARPDRTNGLVLRAVP
ncbi:hypothetical protein GGR56DRAFT_492497 [Xylariaceae sp. FL0804]|nr:hypothetical protein GGR56DRAFT_492497 [Xylariaceae sp. FL0804]